MCTSTHGITQFAECGSVSPTVQFFFSLLIIFAIEVAAGIWGFSNQSKVTHTFTT